VRTSLDSACGLGPAAIARYCLPFTANVIGGAEKPEPTHNKKPRRSEAGVCQQKRAALTDAATSPRYRSRRSLRSLYNLCRSLGSLRSLYKLGLVVRRAGVFLRSPCRLAEGEDHAAAGSADHSQELGGLG
jgi:hypothetical protein